MRGHVERWPAVTTQTRALIYRRSQTTETRRTQRKPFSTPCASCLRGSFHKVAGHECTSRCASSTSSTLSSIRNRGISSGDACPVTNDGRVEGQIESRVLDEVNGLGLI